MNYLTLLKRLYTWSVSHIDFRTSGWERKDSTSFVSSSFGRSRICSGWYQFVAFILGGLCNFSCYSDHINYAKRWRIFGRRPILGWSRKVLLRTRCKAILNKSTSVWIDWQDNRLDVMNFIVLHMLHDLDLHGIEYTWMSRRTGKDLI